MKRKNKNNEITMPVATNMTCVRDMIEYLNQFPNDAVVLNPAPYTLEVITETDLELPNNETSFEENTCQCDNKDNYPCNMCEVTCDRDPDLCVFPGHQELDERFINEMTIKFRNMMEHMINYSNLKNALICNEMVKIVKE